MQIVEQRKKCHQFVEPQCHQLMEQHLTNYLGTTEPLLAFAGPEQHSGGEGEAMTFVQNSTLGVTPRYLTTNRPFDGKAVI